MGLRPPIRESYTLVARRPLSDGISNAGFERDRKKAAIEANSIRRA